LETEPLARPRVAGLYLVDHHQQTAFVAQGAHIAHVLILGGQHAALALHRLEQHGCHGWIDRRLERLDVVVGDVAEAVGIGKKGSCLAGCPVAASAANVRPWKLPNALTTACRPRPPNLRASFRAVSLASAPLLQKNT
jgi:hypothetical protein